MHIDEIKELLKDILVHLTVITEFVTNCRLAQKVEELTHLVEAEDSWQRKDSVELLKEHQAKKQLLIEYHDLLRNYTNISDLTVLLDEEDEATIQDDIKQLLTDTREVLRNAKKFKLYILLQEKNDDSNCFLEINSGAGGTESQDWAEILMRMYLRFAEREGFKASILDLQSGEGAGIKSASLYLQRKYAYGLLRPESGVHRLVRISPFDANKRRHTSFASITAYPEIDDTSVGINADDLKIDTYRAGGAGGQHVNKTESAVRITHLPTNIVVQCQNERSQLQNKATAMKMLAARLAEKQEAERKATHDKTVERKKIEWGSQIRSYVLHPYKLVKDHRTGFEVFNAEEVLDGNIMDFVEAFLSKPTSSDHNEMNHTLPGE